MDIMNILILLILNIYIWVVNNRVKKLTDYVKHLENSFLVKKYSELELPTVEPGKTACSRHGWVVTVKGQWNTFVCPKCVSESLEELK